MYHHFCLSLDHLIYRYFSLYGPPTLGSIELWGIDLFADIHFLDRKSHFYGSFYLTFSVRHSFLFSENCFPIYIYIYTTVLIAVVITGFQQFNSTRLETSSNYKICREVVEEILEESPKEFSQENSPIENSVRKIWVLT